MNTKQAINNLLDIVLNEGALIDRIEAFCLLSMHMCVQGGILLVELLHFCIGLLWSVDWCALFISART